MSCVKFGGLLAAMAAASMLFGSSAAVASAPVPSSQPDAWASLSMLSGSLSASTLCGSAAAVAGSAATVGQGGCVLPQVDAAPQAATNPPPKPVPVPPVEAAGGGLYLDPLLLGLGVLAIGALAYFLLFKKSNDTPLSPG
jgi:hypothetical protein